MANKIDLADAQLLGFYHGKHYSSDVIGLVKSMGLTKKEWLIIKSEYPTISSMDEDDVKDIDAHFGVSQHERQRYSGVASP